jgi:hypothetical protein
MQKTKFESVKEDIHYYLDYEWTMDHRTLIFKLLELMTIQQGEIDALTYVVQNLKKEKQ